MTTKTTFENVTRVTPDYDGGFVGRGWYAYRCTVAAYGTTSEHIAIEYIEWAEDMTEDYVGYVGDYAFAVAEVESSSDYVLSLYFSDDYDAIEDALAAEYLEGLRDGDPDVSEDEAREWARMGMADIDEHGCVRGKRVMCEYYDAHIIA